MTDIQVPRVCNHVGVISQRPIIVFGAGSLGRRVARALEADFFCDNNQNLWGTSVQGVPVESPAAAVQRWPNATFVVAIWHPSRTESMPDRIASLKALGASHAVPFTDFLEDYGDQLLPNFLWAKRDYYEPLKAEIAAGRALLDQSGQEEFDRQMRLRHGDYENQVVDPGNQYFAPEIALSDSEVFVDCGAFDGDTVKEFKRTTGNRFRRIIAFEPDPLNLVKLRDEANGDERIEIRPFAVGARQEVLRFAAAGTGSHFSQQGDLEVQVIPLDEALSDVAPTYIKFDIEGSELDALDGGQETIRRHRPRLAVCVYHLPDHLWRIPLRLHELVPDSRLTLRTYYSDGFDCVCYCIPR